MPRDRAAAAWWGRSSTPITLEVPMCWETRMVKSPSCVPRSSSAASGAVDRRDG